MTCIESTGKPKPADFEPGEAETLEALEFLNSGEPILFYDNIALAGPKSIIF